MWRHRLAVLVAGLLVVAVSAYELTLAAPSATNGDCADTAMAALTHTNESTARAAYACLGPGMRTTSEDQFVATMRQRSSGDATDGRANRVADKQTSNGKIVFYTVSASGQPSVGYLVYLDQEGKITKVE